MRNLKNLTILACLVLFLTPAYSKETKLLTTNFKYFSMDLKLKYDPEMMIGEDNVCMQEKCFKEFYKLMDKAPYQLLLDDLQLQKKKMNLNDWFYFKMVQSGIDDILSKEEDLYKSYVTWFLLNKSGYDIRIAVTDAEQAFLYAYALDDVGDVPSYTEKDKRYINLTSIDLEIDSRKIELKKPNYVANKKGNGFSFAIDKLPNLPNTAIEKVIKFKVHDVEQQVTVKVDENVLKMLENYPALTDMGYVEAPLSKLASNSLVPQLKELIKGKSTKEGLETLISFTRSGFVFKWDWNVFKEDRPMFAEQVLASEFSDHEDRVALFYYLVKEIYDLPMVMATHYNNNLTLGVEWEENMKRPFEHEGRQYLICDPTNPGSSSTLGKWPNGMTPITTTVIGTYK